MPSTGGGGREGGSSPLTRELIHLAELPLPCRSVSLTSQTHQFQCEPLSVCVLSVGMWYWKQSALELVGPAWLV